MHLMVLSNALQFIVGMAILFGVPGNSTFTYFLATAHPLTRLPVFFMGICAGILCIRIQNKDFDALNRMYQL